MFTFKKRPLSDDEQYVAHIIHNLSNKKEIKKMISPISNEYYLVDDKNKLAVSISDGEVILSNHIFLYKKIFSLSFTDNLKKQVRENMEKEMQEMKKSLFQNETSLLSNILKLSTDDKAPVVIKPIFKAL